MTNPDYVVFQSDLENLTASDVGAVPISRTVNGKELSADINLSASDVGAAKASYHKWREYNDLSDIGITKGSETFEAILTEMPTYSQLSYVTTGANNRAIYPYIGGICEIKKLTNIYAKITFTMPSGGVKRGLYEKYCDYNNGGWVISDWYKSYNELNPPTASDVGAYTKEEVDDLVENATPDGVLLADGTVPMTGDFKMSKTYPELRLTNTSSGRSAILQAYPDYTEVGDYANSSNYRMLRIKPASEDVADGVTIAQMNGGAWNNYKLYGEHNPPAPEDIGAVSKTLIWENPKHGNAFAGKTIDAAGILDYDAIEIVFLTKYLYGGYKSTGLIPCEDENHFVMDAIYLDDTPLLMTRNGYIGVDSVYFEYGSECATNSAEPTESQTACIPEWIYGIKF